MKRTFLICVMFLLAATGWAQTTAHYRNTPKGGDSDLTSYKVIVHDYPTFYVENQNKNNKSLK